MKRTLMFAVMLLATASSFAQSSGSTPPPPPYCTSANAGALYTNTGTSPATVYTCSYYNLVWQWVVNPSYGGLVSYPTVPATCSGSLPVFLAGWPNTQLYVCVNGVPVPEAIGPPGPVGPSGPPLNWRGNWAAYTPYARNDGFVEAGIGYVVFTSYTSGATFGSLDTANSVQIATGCAGGVCQIPQGGTGATTAAGALANLNGLSISPSRLNYVTVIDSGNGNQNPGLATLPDNIMLAVWNDALPSPNTINSSQSYNFGANWITPMQLNGGGLISSPLTPGYNSLTLLQNGNLFLAMGMGSSATTPPGLGGIYNSIGTISNQITTVPMGNYPFAGVKDNSGNLWFSNLSDNTLIEFTYASGYNYAGGSLATGTYSLGAGCGGTSLAVDPSNNIWVACGGSSKVLVVNQSGAVTYTITTPGPTPYSIAYNSHTAAPSMWVIDSTNGTIVQINASTFSVVGSQIDVGTTSSTPGAQPSAVAVDSAGNIFVVNYNQTPPGTIPQYTSNLTILNSAGVWQSNYSLQQGESDAIVIDSASNVYVGGLQGTITQLTSAGGVIGTFAAASTVSSLAIDSNTSTCTNGCLWVPDYTGNAMTEWQTNPVNFGAKLNSYGTGGSEPASAVIDNSATKKIWTTNTHSANVSNLTTNNIVDHVTWSAVAQIPNPAGWGSCWNSAPAAQLANGHLVLPVWCYYDNAGDYPLTSGVMTSASTSAPYVFGNFTIVAGPPLGYVPAPPYPYGNGYDEAALQVFPNGDIVWIGRHEQYPTGDPYGSYARSISHDGGATWSVPVDVLSTIEVGRPSLALTGGILTLCGRGSNTKGPSENICSESIDEGASFSPPNDVTVAGSVDAYEALTVNSGTVYELQDTTAKTVTLPSSGTDSYQLNFTVLTPNGLPITPGTNGDNLSFSNLHTQSLTTGAFAAYNPTPLLDPTGAKYVGIFWDTSLGATSTMVDFNVPNHSPSLFGSYATSNIAGGWQMYCPTSNLTSVLCFQTSPAGTFLTQPVGIGISTPYSTLHVDSTGASQTTALANAVANSALLIQPYGSTTQSALAFGDIGAFNGQSIQGLNITNHSVMLPILLNPFGGNVGVNTGTTAPAQALEVNGNILSDGQFMGAGTGLTGTAAGLSIGGTASNLSQGAWTDLTTITISCGTGSLTSYSTDLRYQITGKTANWRFFLSISSLGSCAGAMTTSAFPFTFKVVNGGGCADNYPSIPIGGTWSNNSGSTSIYIGSSTGTTWAATSRQGACSSSTEIQ